MKEIVVADLERGSGPQKAVRLRRHVDLQLGLERIIEARVDRHVQSVAALKRVERSHAQIDVPENAELVQIGLGRVLSVDRKKFSRTQVHVAGEHFRADFPGRVEIDPHVPHAHRIARFRTDILQVDRDIPYPVRSGRLSRDAGFEQQTQVHFAAFPGRIGLIFEIFGTEIVVASVAKNPGKPGALRSQRIDIVLSSRFQQRRTLQAVDQRGQRSPDGRIGDPAVAPRRRCIDTVTEPGFPAVLLIARLVLRPGAEIAVVGQNVAYHLDAQLGLYRRDQHGVLGQTLVKPVLESLRLFGMQIVVRPQSDRKRSSYVGTVQRIVRFDRERVLDGGFDIGRHMYAGVCLDRDFADSRIEHFVLPQTLGRGTAGNKGGGRQKSDMQSVSFHLFKVRLPAEPVRVLRLLSFRFRPRPSCVRHRRWTQRRSSQGFPSRRNRRPARGCA